MKRKLDSNSEEDAAGKRLKLTNDSHSKTALELQATASNKSEVGTDANVGIKKDTKGKNTDKDKVQIGRAHV